MWEIYSIGDAAFLERVLNAVAMLAGTGDLEKVAAIGMLVGLLILGFQSILQGGEGIKFQNLLVSWILFAIMFGAGTRVAIEDVYTGHIRIVDNVPYGIAAAGSMVSQLGYGVTSLFEQSFGDVQMTEHGFAYALESLANLRKMSLSRANLGSANSPAPGDDIWQSWRNYIADCTMAGVDLGEIQISDIQRSARGGGSGSHNILAQLQWESSAYGTELKLASAIGGGFQTCSQAYGTLSAYTTGPFSLALQKRAAEQFGVPFTEVGDRIQLAFQAIDQASVDSQNYMLATVMTPIFEWAMVDNEINFQKTSTASMLHTAIQQRNEQWAAEQALFNTVVRPMMTFFEGLVFAITPMMAFLIGLGPMGIGLMGKYLMIILWIQLWMPVLSIINLYLHMAVAGKMSALQDPSKGNLPLESFYGIYSLDQTLQTWIATGGMLAASVPAITLMLIYGGAITASSVASRMSSGNVPTSVSTPAVANTDPLFERASMRQSSNPTGLSETGAKGLTMSINGGYSQALSSSREEVSAKQSAFMKQLSSAVNSTGQSSEQVQQNLTRSVNSLSEDSEAFQALRQVGQEWATANGITENLSNNAQAQLGAQVVTGVRGEAGVGAGYAAGSSSVTPRDGEEASADAPTGQSPGGTRKGGAANASAGVNVSHQHGVGAELKSLQGSGKSQDHQAGERGTNAFSTSTQSGARVAHALAKLAANSENSGFMKSLGIADSDTLSESASEVLTASDKYAANSQFQQSMGIINSIDDNRVSRDIRELGLTDDVQEFFREYGGQGGLTDSAGQFKKLIAAKNKGMSDEDTTLAGQAFAIADGRFLDKIDDPAIRESIAIQGANIMGRLAGIETPNQTDYSSNRGGQASVVPDERASGVKEEVEQKVPGVNVDRDDLRENIDQGFAAGRNAVGGPGNSEIIDHYDAARERAVSQNENNANAYNSEAAEERYKNILRATQNNEQIRNGVDGAESAIGGLTAGSLLEQGFINTLKGNNGGSRLANEIDMGPALSRDEFMALSPEQREEVAMDTKNKLSTHLQQQGMAPAGVDLLASVATPFVLQSHLGDSSGIASTLRDQVDSTDWKNSWEAITGTTQPLLMDSMERFREHAGRSTGTPGAADAVTQDVTASFIGAMRSRSTESEQIHMDLANGMIEYGQVTPWKDVDRTPTAPNPASALPSGLTGSADTNDQSLKATQDQGSNTGTGGQSNRTDADRLVTEAPAAVPTSPRGAGDAGVTEQSYRVADSSQGAGALKPLTTNQGGDSVAEQSYQVAGAQSPLTPTAETTGTVSQLSGESLLAASEVDSSLNQLEASLARQDLATEGAYGSVAGSVNPEVALMQNYAQELQEKLQELQQGFASGASQSEIDGLLQEAQQTAQLLDATPAQPAIQPGVDGDMVAANQVEHDTAISPDPFAPDYSSPTFAGVEPENMGQNQLSGFEPVTEPLAQQAAQAQDLLAQAQGIINTPDPLDNGFGGAAWYQGNASESKSKSYDQAVADYTDKPKASVPSGPTNPMIS